MTSNENPIGARHHYWAIISAAALLVAAALPAGCASDRQLNSDRIQARYGSYAVRVLYQDRDWRVSSLESRHGGRLVTRTLALVQYMLPDEPALADLHGRIRSGDSIGITFRRAGWCIEKRALFIGNVRVPGEATVIADLMRIPVPATVAAHAYRFDIVRDGRRFHYATIIEMHHPGYLAKNDLHKLFGVPEENARAAAAIRRAVGMLSMLPTRLVD